MHAQKPTHEACGSPAQVLCGCPSATCPPLRMLTQSTGTDQGGPLVVLGSLFGLLFCSRHEHARTIPGLFPGTSRVVCTSLNK